MKILFTDYTNFSHKKHENHGLVSLMKCLRKVELCCFVDHLRLDILDHDHLLDWYVSDPVDLACAEVGDDSSNDDEQTQTAPDYDCCYFSSSELVNGVINLDCVAFCESSLVHDGAGELDCTVGDFVVWKIN